VIRRLRSVAVAAAGVAALSSMVVPQHAASLAVLGAATVAVVAAAFVLVLAGPLVAADPPTWPGRSPPAGAPPPLDPQGLRDARRTVRRRLAAGADARALLDELAPDRTTRSGGPR